MKRQHNDAQSTSQQVDDRQNRGSKMREMTRPSEVVDRILDVRVVEDELEFLCCIRDKSKLLWVKRSACQADDLIQHFFDKRTRQFLLAEERSDKRCSIGGLVDNKPTSLMPNDTIKSELKVSTFGDISGGEMSFRSPSHYKFFPDFRLQPFDMGYLHQSW